MNDSDSSFISTLHVWLKEFIQLYRIILMRTATPGSELTEEERDRVFTDLESNLWEVFLENADRMGLELISYKPVIDPNLGYRISLLKAIRSDTARVFGRARVLATLALIGRASHMELTQVFGEDSFFTYQELETIRLNFVFGTSYKRHPEKFSASLLQFKLLKEYIAQEKQAYTIEERNENTGDVGYLSVDATQQRNTDEKRQKTIKQGATI